MSNMENIAMQKESFEAAGVVSANETNIKVVAMEEVSAAKIDTVKDNQNIPDQEDSEKKQLSVEEKTEVVQALNKAVELFDNNIRFVRGSDTDDETVYVEVYNKETGDVIRRLPPENLKKSLKNISELTGLLIDQIG